MSIAQLPAVAARVDDRLARADLDDVTFRAVADEAGEIRLHAAARVASAALRDADAGTVIEWASHAIPNFVVTSSFGADAAVLLHLVARSAPATPVIFLDTGLHFPETIAYRDHLADLLGLDVVTIRPALEVAQQDRLHGRRLFARDAETCCMLRKGLPLRAALASADGWATGLRRAQTPSRADTPIVGTARKGDRVLLKVAPLAAWSDDDMLAHRRDHDLPPHPLEARGYRSIGCEPCTRPTGPGEDARAGRWAHEPDREECGIHVDPVLGLVRTRS